MTNMRAPTLSFLSFIRAPLNRVLLVLAFAALGGAAVEAQDAASPSPSPQVASAPPPGPPPQIPSTPNPPPLKMEEIDQLVAPVALYPDTLLAQVLIASTYPLEVAMAAQWAQQNANLKGEQLNAAVEMQTWDPSVKALVQVPTALQQMSGRLDWTQKLGDAFLAQQTDVMDSVQRLRRRAQDAGKLMTTEQQKVVDMGQTIVIQQADPQTVYVPYYDPYYAYGGWPYAAYPPYYWATPPGYYLGAGLAFGLGVAIVGGAWDNDFDWNGGDLNVNVDRDRFTNVDRSSVRNSERWQHNSEHRRGTNYRDQATRERFGKANASQASARGDFRGFDQGQIGNQLGDRGGFQNSSLQKTGQISSFDRMGNSSSTRNLSSRGQSSRQASSRSYSGGGASRGFSGGGRGFSGGGGGFRGGGGGGRR
jgi:hypothetical protein